MAVKQVTQVHCDRCGKVIEEGKARDPSAAHLVYAEGTLLGEEGKIDFVDLCTKCESRAQSLFAQLRLDDPPKTDDNAAAASNQKPSNPKEAKASAKT
jgi:hypothetical protein